MTSTLSPYAYTPGMATREAEAIVKDFRSRLRNHKGLEVPANVKVSEEPTMDALAEADSKTGRLTVNAATWAHSTPARRKMTIAHELSHLRHKDSNLLNAFLPPVVASLGVGGLAVASGLALRKKFRPQMDVVPVLAVSMIPGQLAGVMTYNRRDHHIESRSEREAILTLRALGYDQNTIEQGLPRPTGEPYPWYNEFFNADTPAVYYEREAWRHYRELYPTPPSPRTP